MERGTQWPATVKTAMVLSAGLGTRMAPANNGSAQAAGAAQRQGADRPCARPPRRGRHRARRRQRAPQGRPDRGAPQGPAGAAGSRFPTSAAQLLDTGGGVKHALPRLGAGPFLIHNADSVWIEGVGSNLARLLEAWDDRAHGLPDAAGAGLATASAIRAAAISPSRPTGASAGGASSRRWCRSRSPACRWRIRGCSRAAPTAPSRSTRCGTRRSPPGRAFGLRMEGTWMHVGTPRCAGTGRAALAATRVRIVQLRRAASRRSSRPAARARAPACYTRRRRRAAVPGGAGARRCSRGDLPVRGRPAPPDPLRPRRHHLLSADAAADARPAGGVPAGVGRRRAAAAARSSRSAPAARSWSCSPASEDFDAGGDADVPRGDQRAGAPAGADDAGAGAGRESQRHAEARRRPAALRGGRRPHARRRPRKLAAELARLMDSWRRRTSTSRGCSELVPDEYSEHW